LMKLFPKNFRRRVAEWLILHSLRSKEPANHANHTNS
jgi:hypothetical protein